MAAVQVSARVDGKIKAGAEKVFNQYGLDTSSAIRAMVTIAAKTRRMPFVIGAPAVSLNGDAFPNDTEYLKQIPGYMESVLKAAKEPVGEGVQYDAETFWDSLRDVDG